MQRLRTSCWVIVEPPSTGFARFEVLDRGAQDPLRVDAAVLVEALVLDRDRRVSCSCLGIRRIATGVRASSEATTPSLLPSPE